MENQSFDKNLARLEQLEAKLEELETKYNAHDTDLDELSADVEKLKVSGLQEQITALSDNFIDSVRHLALLKIEFLRLSLIVWAHDYLDETTSPTQSLYLQKILLFSVSARSEVKLSTVPLEVAEQFREKCKKYCKEYNLKAFLDL